MLFMLVEGLYTFSPMLLLCKLVIMKIVIKNWDVFWFFGKELKYRQILFSTKVIILFTSRHNTPFLPSSGKTTYKV